MMAFEGLPFLLGFLLGLVASSLFFIGLAWGVGLALKSSRPNSTLFISFVLRLGWLLGIGFLLASLTATLWPILGYALAYFVVRFIALRRAKREILNATNA